MVILRPKTTYILSLKTLIVLVLATTVLLFQSTIIMAKPTVSDDEAVADLLGDDIIPTTTFGRSVQPLNRVAENVTVITRADIVRLQARTLDQLLLYYPGVLPYPYQYPGGFSTPMIQGFSNRHILVTLDGVPLNLISEGAVDLSLIPVGNFDSVEIVKGPTSSLWGRSVGGSINIVTRNPAESKAAGYLNATLGMNNTNSAESVVSGTNDSTHTGYLLAGSGGTTDGFQRGIKGSTNAFYGKLQQQIDNKTTVTGVLGKTAQNATPFNNLLENVKANLDENVYYGIVRFNHAFSLNSEIELNTFYFDVGVKTRYFNIAPIPGLIPVSGSEVKNQSTYENYCGAQLSYKYYGPKYWFSLGIDGMNSKMSENVSSLVAPSVNLQLDKSILNIAAYVTGGLDLTDNLTLTASFRQDWYSDLQNTSAPSAGFIYKVGEKAVLRATYGWGYSLPVLNNTSKEFENLWRVQGGLETSIIPSIWLKTNFFYDRTRNVRQNIFTLNQGTETNRNLIRQGFEIEAKTVPVFNTTFGAGYTYTDIYNSDTGSPIRGLPRHQFIGSVNWNYADTGIGVYSRYVDYNDAPISNDSLLWDVMASQRIARWNTSTISLRLAVQNVFGGRQTPSPLAYGYVPLLVTGGVRVEF